MKVTTKEDQSCCEADKEWGRKNGAGQGLANAAVKTARTEYYRDKKKKTQIHDYCTEIIQVMRPCAAL